MQCEQASQRELFEGLSRGMVCKEDPPPMNLAVDLLFFGKVDPCCSDSCPSTRIYRFFGKESSGSFQLALKIQSMMLCYL